MNWMTSNPTMADLMTSISGLSVDAFQKNSAEGRNPPSCWKLIAYYGGLIGGTVDANTPGKNPVDARRGRKTPLDARSMEINQTDAKQKKSI